MLFFGLVFGRSGWPLIRQATFVEDGQLGVDSGPILPSARPFGRDVDNRQVRHFQQAVIRWEDRLETIPKLV